MAVVGDSGRWRVLWKNLGQFFLACALIFVLIEGMSSTLLCLYDIFFYSYRLSE
jgi:hypothetical protein